MSLKPPLQYTTVLMNGWFSLSLLNTLSTFQKLTNSIWNDMLDESLLFILTIYLYLVLILSHIMMTYVKLWNDYVKTS